MKSKSAKHNGKRVDLHRLVMGWWKQRKRPSYEFQFDPKEDITAWEVAQIFPSMIPSQYVHSVSFLAKQPQTVLRHILFEGRELTVAKIQELKELDPT